MARNWKESDIIRGRSGNLVFKGEDSKGKMKIYAYGHHKDFDGPLVFDVINPMKINSEKVVVKFDATREEAVKLLTSEANKSNYNGAIQRKNTTPAQREWYDKMQGQEWWERMIHEGDIDKNGKSLNGSKDRDYDVYFKKPDSVGEIGASYRVPKGTGPSDSRGAGGTSTSNT